jgi:hypothetical protein
MAFLQTARVCSGQRPAGPSGGIHDWVGSLIDERSSGLRRGARSRIDVAAASLQGTLAELARMLQVGVIPGPATRWKADLVAFFRKVATS